MLFVVLGCHWLTFVNRCSHTYSVTLMPRLVAEVGDSGGRGDGADTEKRTRISKAVEGHVRPMVIYG